MISKQARLKGWESRVSRRRLTREDTIKSWAKVHGGVLLMQSRQKIALLSSAAALPLLLSSPAFSASQSVNWTGFYAGATAGADWSKSSQSTNLPCTEPGGAGYVCGVGFPGDGSAIAAALSNSYSNSGFIGGGEAGYNWQYGPAVYGVEVDFQNFRGASTSATVVANGTSFITGGSPISLTSSTDAHWLVTVRGRVGYAFDRLLVYGTGGLAITRLSTSFSYSDPTPGHGSWAQSDTKSGFVAGAGVEWALTKNWSVKAEYLHVHFDASTARGAIASPIAFGYSNAISTSADLTAEIARAGVNYKF